MWEGALDLYVVLRRGVGLYKIFLFLFVIILLLTVDGTLTYDIFEFKMGTVFDWLTFVIILGIVGGIYFADQGKKRGK